MSIFLPPRQYQAGDAPVPGYHLVSLLGRGGFGEVWKATTTPGRTEAALKILTRGSYGLGKELRAANRLKGIHHVNLVPITGIWVRDAEGNFLNDLPESEAEARADELLIAMTLGDMNLARRLDECKESGLAGIPPDELLRYLEDAARAIDYLNGPSFVIQHCDIKPQNIIIVGGSAQVCDFGLARVLLESRESNIGGTPLYAAPEVQRENKPSRSTDQYSLAITYYELRTGRPPFLDNLPPALIMMAHLEGTLDFTHVPAAEQECLRKATHLDPEQRYASCQEMVRQLRIAGFQGATAGSASADEFALTVTQFPELGTGVGVLRRYARLLISVVLLLFALGIVVFGARESVRRQTTKAIAAGEYRRAAEELRTWGWLLGESPRLELRERLQGTWKHAVLTRAAQESVAEARDEATAFFSAFPVEAEETRRAFDGALLDRASRLLEQARTRLDGDEASSLALLDEVAEILPAEHPDQRTVGNLRSVLIRRGDERTAAAAVQQAVAACREASGEKQVQGFRAAVQLLGRDLPPNPYELCEAVRRVTEGRPEWREEAAGLLAATAKKAGLLPDKERKQVEDWSRELLIAHLAVLAPSLPEVPGGFAAFRKRCEEAGDALALRPALVECLAEAHLDGDASARARLKDLELANLEDPHARYARALARWRLEFAPAAEARDMATALAPGGSWANAHRRGRLVQLAEDAVGRALDAKATANEVHPWLALAAEYAGGKASPTLRTALALASWHKTDPDRRRAGELAEALTGGLSTESFKSADVALKRDAPALLLIAAGAQPETAAGLEARVKALTQFIDLAEAELLTSPAPKEFFTTVLEPRSRADEALAKLEDTPARRTAAAKRLAELGRWLLDNENAELGFSTVGRALEVYDRSIALDGSRARARVGRAHAALRLPGADLVRLKTEAEAAIQADETFAGGHVLLSRVLIFQSREPGRSLSARRALLEQARTAAQTAGERCPATSPDYRDLGAAILINQSNALVELANYSTGRKHQREYLDKAVDIAKQATQLPHRYHVDYAWSSLGNAREDLGYLCGDAASYDAALDAFDRAIAAAPFYAQAYVNRGRCRYRQVVHALLRDPNLDGARRKDLLARIDRACDDLKDGLARRRESRTGAEATYFLANAQAVRAQLEPARAAALVREALDGFTETLRLADAHPSPDWWENAQRDAAEVALRRADALGLGDAAEVARLLGVARSALTQLRGRRPDLASPLLRRLDEQQALDAYDRAELLVAENRRTVPEFGRYRATMLECAGRLGARGEVTTALFLTGKAEELQGRVVVAERIYRTALALDPRFWLPGPGRFLCALFGPEAANEKALVRLGVAWVDTLCTEDLLDRRSADGRPPARPRRAIPFADRLVRWSGPYPALRPWALGAAGVTRHLAAGEVTGAERLAYRRKSLELLGQALSYLPLGYRAADWRMLFVLQTIDLLRTAPNHGENPRLYRDALAVLDAARSDPAARKYEGDLGRLQQALSEHKPARGEERP